jgi:hypothetical protein
MAAEEVKIKRSQLLTIGKLTRKLSESISPDYGIPGVGDVRQNGVIDHQSYCRRGS